MKSATMAVTILAALWALAGCQRETGEEMSVSDGKGWAADACMTFPAEAAAKAAGVAVTGAVAGGKSTVSGTQVSSCTYQLAGNRSFTVLMRHQGEKGDMKRAIAGLNAAPDVTGPVAEVPVPNGKAYWTQRYRTLSYIPDEKRIVVVTPPGAVAGPANASDEGLKDKALAIARAAAGSTPAASGG